MNTLLILVDTAFEVYFWLLVAHVILSWFPAVSSGGLAKIADFVYDVTEPPLRFIRKYIPVVQTGAVGIDFSPFVAMILLQVLRRVVNQVLSAVIL